MTAFSNAQLSRMQATQQAHLMDTCQVLLRLPGTTDDYGYPAKSWEASITTSCGFKPVSPKEALGQTEVPLFDATLRLPIALYGTVTNLDRIKVTYRHGVALASPETFAIVGQPARGPSGLVVKLKRITDGSDT